jgi:hypothetical protein
MSDASWIALISLATTIAGFIYTWYKDSRDRKWAIEDAERKAAALLLDGDAKAAVLASAISEGTKKAADAYQEANSVNMKIKDLNENLTLIHEKLDTKAQK